VSEIDRYINEIEDYKRDCSSLQMFLRTHPDLPIGFVSGRCCYLLPPSNDDGDIDVSAVAAVVRTMKDGGKVDKRSWDDSMTYSRTLGHKAKLEMTVSRKAVCERIVTGTETVTIPAVAERVETREIVEWECAPVLRHAQEDETEVEVDG
jgi:hypothetical protein